MASAQIAELCCMSAWSDREARSDLIHKVIVSEGDYTSNFTSALRRNINSHSRTGLTATSQLLPPRMERGTGCDAAIVVQSGDASKVLLIEGKWPRLSLPSHPWDWAQTAAGDSHFSDQLIRQARLTKSFAIAEMFYCEDDFKKQPPCMNSSGSSCVWHADAAKYDATRPTAPKVWSRSELVGLLKGGVHSIEHIVEQVCQCNEGLPLPLKGDEAVAGWDFHLPSNILVIKADPDFPDEDDERVD